VVRQADNIIWRRINEAKEFTKLFTSDKSPEMRNPGSISSKIKCKLKIKCGKCFQIPLRKISIKKY
jgi:hypothetical protein